eukprot:s459_g5.t1
MAKPRKKRVRYREEWRAWEEFLPGPGEASPGRWCLRVLLAEAREAVVATPGLLEMAQLRPRAGLAHMLGLIFELHSQEEKTTGIPRSLWWSSLRIVRDLWESPKCLEMEIRLMFREHSEAVHCEKYVALVELTLAQVTGGGFRIHLSRST